MTQPIKRNEALKPWSREHHHSLLLSWKINTGLKKKVDVHRIKTYCDWFFKAHLSSHFDTEEQFIFPVLGNVHPNVQRAKKEHAQLRKLFSETENVESALREIVTLLKDHVRFEERTLFAEIQKIATPAQWENINKLHYEANTSDNLDDEFWV